MEHERTAGDDPGLGDALRLARNLCAGIGAFFVTSSGEVRLSLSASTCTESLADRSRALARTCLNHPDARCTEPFLTAEALEDYRTPDETLACAALPVLSGDRRLGVLGVVDNWLPDLDEEQLSGLHQVAQQIVQVAGAAAASIAQPTPLADRPAPLDYQVATAAPAPVEDAAPIEDAALLEDTASVENTASVEDTAGPAPSEDAFAGALAQHLPDGVVVLLDDGTIVYANPKMAELTGTPTADILGTDITSWLEVEAGAGSGRDPASTSDPVAALVDPGPPGGRLLLQRASGEPIVVAATSAPMPLPRLRQCTVVLLRAETTRVESGSPSIGVDALLSAVEDGVVLCDPSGALLAANRQARWLGGLDGAEEHLGRPAPTLFPLAAGDGSPLGEEAHPLSQALAGQEVVRERGAIERAADDRRQVAVSARPVPLRSGIGAVMILRDVTSDIEEEARLTHLALHDPLTGLANRLLLRDHLERALRDPRTVGHAAALVLLDLDSFKAVNDRYGHAVGDDLLVLIARRIQHAVRPTEVVARLGGDEFVVVCTTVSDGADLELMVERLRKALAAPFQIGSATLSIGASIGSVVADRRRDTPDTLLARADAEMYRSKEQRRQRRAEPA